MRVLVADKFEKSGLDGLAALGCEVVYEPEAKEAALVEAVRRAAPEVLIVRGTKVDAAACTALADRCSSIEPNAARIVAAIGIG